MSMKTGKRMVIEDINQFLLPSEKHKYPIILCERLTAVMAIPLWYENHRYECAIIRSKK